MFSEYSKARYRSIDAWRGTACLLVVWFHAGDMAISRNQSLGNSFFWRASLIGEIGVPMFFVISGYCMIQSAAQLTERENRTFTFIKQRFRRIYPAYFITAVLALILLLAGSFLSASGKIEKNEFTEFDYLHQPFLYYLSNLTLTQAFFKQKSLVYVSWTLCYELAFYLVIAVSLAFYEYKDSVKKIITGVEFISLACLILAFTLRYSTPFPLEWFPVFGMGASVWRVLNSQSKRHELVPAVLIAIGALIVGLRFNLPWGYMGQMSRQIFLSGVGFSVILILGRKRDLQFSSLKAVKALSFVGKISYSVYLSHLYVIHIVDQISFHLPNSKFYTPLLAVSAGILALPAGYLFHLAFEKPFYAKKVASVE